MIAEANDNDHSAKKCVFSSNTTGVIISPSYKLQATRFGTRFCNKICNNKILVTSYEIFTQLIAIYIAKLQHHSAPSAIHPVLLV